MSLETWKYQLTKLTAIPPEMRLYQDAGMNLKLFPPTEFGAYVLVACEPSDKEREHQFLVVDENNHRLGGIPVVVADNNSDSPPVWKPSYSHWAHGETDLHGAVHWTDETGYASHTAGALGGERIWVWDVDEKSVCRLSSPKVENCPILAYTPGPYHNHGVRLTFQRRRLAQPTPPTGDGDPGTFISLSKQIDELRQQVAQLEPGIDEMRANLPAWQQDLETQKKNAADAAQGGPVPNWLTGYIHQLEAKQAALQQAEAQVTALQNQVQALVAQREPLTAALFGLAPADLPLCLLPVRLETRFVDRNQGKDLLLRIYPDSAHVNSHDPELTPTEVKWGEQYWSAVKGFRQDETDKRRLAWEHLAGRFGAPRAAWIVDALDPAPPSQRPGMRAEGEWSAPFTEVLPDRWLAMGYDKEMKRSLLDVWEKPTQKTLDTGPSPRTSKPVSDSKDVGVDENMRWMVDFETARAAGMGHCIPLTKEQAERGFEWLVVYGLRTSFSAWDASEHMKGLLSAHRYTRGLSFLSQDTPTNNTPTARSGYAAHPSSPPAPRSSGEQLAPDSDGARLARALGLDIQTFAQVQNGDGQEDRDSRAMHAALWPATLDYFMRQGYAGHYADADISQVRRHFIEFVRGRGPLSALRIGSQPYGLLPVIDPVEWRPADESAAQIRLFDLMRRLRPFWQRSIPQVPRVGRIDPSDSQTGQPDPETDQPDRDLALVMTMSANSYAYGLRDHLGEQTVRLFANTQKNSNLDLQRVLTAGLLDSLRLPPDARIATLSSLEELKRFDGPLVQFDPLSSTDPLAPNYIVSLTKNGWNQIITGADSASLLYRLLRHAALLTYLVTAYRLRLEHGVGQPGNLIDPDLFNIEDSDELKTFWILQRQVPGLTVDAEGNPISVGRWLDNHKDLASVPPEERGQSPMAEFGEFWQSLQHLAARPTALLNGVLPPTLDVCSHRLDAWNTSFATARLFSIRQDLRERGIVLGSYGWLEKVRPGVQRESLGYIHTPSLGHAATAAVLRNSYLNYRDQLSNPFAVDLSSGRVRLALWFLEGFRQGVSLAALLGYRFERALHHAHLDVYLRPFRRLLPLLGVPGVAAEAVDLWRQLQDANEIVNEKHPQLRPLLDELKALQKQLAQDTKDKITTQTNLDKCNATIKQWNQLDKEITDLKARLDEKQQQLDELPDPPEILFDDRGKPIKGSDTDTHAKERADLQADIDSLRTQIDQKQAEKDKLPILQDTATAILLMLGLEEYTRDIKRLQAQIPLTEQLYKDTCCAWRTALRTARKLEAELQDSKLTPDLVKAWLAILTAEKEFTKAESALKAAQEQQRTSCADYQTKQATVDSINAEIGAIDLEVGKQQGEIDAANRELNTLQGKLHGLQQPYEDTYYNGHGNITVWVDPDKAERSKLERQIQTQNKRIDDANEAKHNLTTERASLVTSLTTAQQIAKDAQDACDGWKDKINGQNGLAWNFDQSSTNLWTAWQAYYNLLFPPGQAQEDIPANNVVDGQELVTRWQNGRASNHWVRTTIPLGSLGLPPGPNEPKKDQTDFKMIDTLIQDLVAVKDALADLAIAESVHHTLRGNPMRAGAAISDDPLQFLPPELDSQRTPRSGVGFTQRLVVLLGQGAPLPGGSFEARAKVEPLLNAWVARLMPDPAAVSAHAEFISPDAKLSDIHPNDIIGTADVNLDELGLSPLDLVYIAEGEGRAQRGELEQRIAYYLLRKHNKAAGVNVRLDFTLPAAGKTGVGEWLEVAQAIRLLLSSARAANGRDFADSADAPTAGIDLGELQGRFDQARAAFENALKDLPIDQKLPIDQVDTSNLDPETLRAALVRISYFDLPGAIPFFPTGDTPTIRQGLYAQAVAVRHDAESRLEKTSAIPSSSREDWQPLLDQFAQLFGKAFRVLPRFNPPNRETLKQAVAASVQVPPGTPLGALSVQAVDWFNRIKYVQPGAGRLDLVLSYAEALGTGEALDLQVIQFPFDPQKPMPWVALDTGQPIPGGCRSTVVHQSGVVNLDDAWAGLVLDQWEEVVPSDSEVTGISFQYDAPTSEPPQVILLAVAPAPEGYWELESTADSLLETLQLARQRPVDLPLLEQVGRLFPALFLATNESHGTVSTRLEGVTQ